MKNREIFLAIASAGVGILLYRAYTKKPVATSATDNTATSGVATGGSIGMPVYITQTGTSQTVIPSSVDQTGLTVGQTPVDGDVILAILPNGTYATGVYKVMSDGSVKLATTAGEMFTMQTIVGVYSPSSAIGTQVMNQYNNPTVSLPVIMTPPASASPVVISGTISSNFAGFCQPSFFTVQQGKFQ